MSTTVTIYFESTEEIEHFMKWFKELGAEKYLKDREPTGIDGVTDFEYHYEERYVILGKKGV